MFTKILHHRASMAVAQRFSLPSVENGRCRGEFSPREFYRTTLGPTSLLHHDCEKSGQPRLFDVPKNSYGSGQNFREPREFGSIIPRLDPECHQKKEVASNRVQTCPRPPTRKCLPDSDRDYPLAGPCIRKPIRKSIVPNPDVSGC